MHKISNKIIRIVLLILVIFLLGCEATSPDKKEAIIYTGTEGITAEFSSNAPQQKVFESSSFPVLIKLRNNGAYDVKNNEGVISIGTEKDYIKEVIAEESSKVSKDEADHVLFSIDGKSQINAKGEDMVIVLKAKTGTLDPQSENKASTMTATLCYPYKTVLSTTVCIDPDISGLRPAKKVCNVKELAFANGQGAPVAVTRIESQMLFDVDKEFIVPQFLIFIENKANGNPVNYNNYKSACGKQDTNSRDLWNVAFVKAFTSGGKDGTKELICCPNQVKCPENSPSSSFVRFIDRKDFVRCTFKDGIPRNFDAYTSPLRVEISYGYVQTITTSFNILKPLSY